MSRLRHPGRRGLERLADGECAPAEARRIRAHLAECPECRAELAWLRELGRALRDIPAPRPPEGTLEAALERREQGERRILPVSDPAPRRRPSRVALAVAGSLVALAAAAALVVLTGREAAAGASELRLPPEALSAARPLTAEFRAASALAGETRLRLRGRYRFAGDAPPRTHLGRPLAAELAREGPGRFRGPVRLPPGAVYAAFSLENLDGDDVDANGGRFWELLERDEVGQPTFRALQERMWAMSVIRWELALETAVEATTLYPDRIEGWFQRLFYEGLLEDREGRARLLAEHAERFAAFERQVAGASAPTVAELAALVRYARSLGDVEAIGRWTERLEAVAPAHRLVVQERVGEIGRAHRDGPAVGLERLEAVWERAGPADETLLQKGFEAALALGDARATLAWADRIDRYVPRWSPGVALRLAERPTLRAEGMARLRRELRRLERAGPDDRPLDLGRAEHRAEAREESAPLLAALGRVLLAEGDSAAAGDTLALAAERTWDPALFRELAAVRAAAGDDEAAVRLRALAAADPLSEAGERAALRLGPGPSIGTEVWRDRLAEARLELQRRARSRSVSRPVPEGVRVMDAAGEERPLLDLLGGRPTLLAYWMHVPTVARRDGARLSGLSGRLRDAGTRAVAVVGRERSPELDAFARDDVTGVVVAFDDHAQAGASLELWGRTRYLVIDGSGRVRFRFREHELDRALRHLLLLAEGAPTLSSDATGSVRGPADVEGATGIATDHFDMGGTDAMQATLDAGHVPRGDLGAASVGGGIQWGRAVEGRVRGFRELHPGSGIGVYGGWTGHVQRAPVSAVDTGEGPAGRSPGGRSVSARRLIDS